jgi:L-ascorbate metabolism protein UlaG (beta-lactamase superfamily)
VIVTGVPALHGPEGSETAAGDCIGFLVTADGHPSLYVSGDNASMRCVSQIAERYAPVDTAVLFIGGVRHKPIFDGALVTIDNDMAAEAAKLLGARRVIPAHIEGWRHFDGTRDDVRAAFKRANLSDRLTFA